MGLIKVILLANSINCWELPMGQSAAIFIKNYGFKSIYWTLKGSVNCCKL